MTCCSSAGSQQLSCIQSLSVQLPAWHLQPLPADISWLSRAAVPMCIGLAVSTPFNILHAILITLNAC